jgi:hypothetical protein
MPIFAKSLIAKLCKNFSSSVSIVSYKHKSVNKSSKTLID